MIERYQTEAMAALWGDEARFARWTQVELAACEAWHARGELPEAEMRTLRERAKAPSPARVSELEKETHHDVVAFVRALGELVGEPARRHLHRGLTSYDVVDTALGLALVQSVNVLSKSVRELHEVVGRRAVELKRTACVGRTHGVHAEPMTFGLRLAGWYTELTRNLARLDQARDECAYGKLSGAVGTFSQTDPLFESFVLDRLGLKCEPVATQVIPRDRHASLVAALCLLASGLERFAVEIRSLQRTELREVEEPFQAGQTGSSAMPHKRNPVVSERVAGLARLVRGYMSTMFENVALWGERDISHSSVERVVLPDVFHAVHYMVLIFTEVMQDLRVYPEAMAENLGRTRGLVFSQNVLGALLAKGLDRAVAYKVVQRAAMRVWEKSATDFHAALREEPEVTSRLSAAELERAFDLGPYLKHVDALFARAGLE